MKKIVLICVSLCVSVFASTPQLDFIRSVTSGLQSQSSNLASLIGLIVVVIGIIGLFIGLDKRRKTLDDATDEKERREFESKKRKRDNPFS